MRTLIIIGLLVAIWLPLMDYAVFRPRRKALPGATALRGFEWLVYVAYLLCLALMAVSSLLMLAFGSHMHRWMLILHMSVAAPFAVCITALALLWAHQARLTREPDAAVRFYPGERVLFWIITAAGFSTISSALLGMMVWFGTVGQDFLLNTHRISSLVLVIASAAQAGRLLFGRAAAGTAAAA